MTELKSKYSGPVETGKTILLGIAGLVLLVSAVTLSDWPVALRFEQASMNYLFVMALCIALPCALLLIAFCLTKGVQKVLVLLCSAAVALPSVLLWVLVNHDYQRIQAAGVDLSFEKLDEVIHQGTAYRLYRSNGGATTAFGLVLRKETELVPGVAMVEPLFSQYKAADGRLTLVDEQSLELQIAADSKAEQQVRFSL